jgi:hypothetical protein
VTVSAGAAEVTLVLEPATLQSLTAPAGWASTRFAATVTLTGFAPPGGAAVAVAALDGLPTQVTFSVPVPIVDGDGDYSLAVSAEYEGSSAASLQ